jgi:hypothetical protein
MGVNKVIYYGEVLVDMSQVTVKPETLAKGETALDASGELITGLHECKETEPKLQSKTVTPATSLQTVNPDSGYDGLSKVTVNAMPTATQATPSISVNSSGLITASATQTAGYVAAGTKTGTKQLTTQAAKTITPSTSSQTAVAKGVYTTGAVTVAAIPSAYVKPTATKAATTYTPTTSNQTIAAGTYCSGAQTIKGDANLIPANIISGKSIFGVTGTAEVGGGSSGESGNVELCDVRIKYVENPLSGISLTRIIYTTFENGLLRTANIADELYGDGTGTGTGSLQHEYSVKCVVGTTMFLFDGNMFAPVYSSSSNITMEPTGDWGEIMAATINSGTSGRIFIETQS